MSTKPDSSPKVMDWKRGNYAMHFLVFDQGNTFIVVRTCDGCYLHYDRFGIAITVADSRTFLREIAVASLLASDPEFTYETP